MPSSITGRKLSCWARLKRWISSTKSSVWRPLPRRSRAASNTFFRSATPEKIAEICSKARSVSPASSRATVVLPVPGGPQKIIEPSEPERDHARQRAVRRRSGAPARRPRPGSPAAAGRPAARRSGSGASPPPNRCATGCPPGRGRRMIAPKTVAHRPARRISAASGVSRLPSRSTREAPAACRRLGDLLAACVGRVDGSPLTSRRCRAAGGRSARQGAAIDVDDDDAGLGRRHVELARRAAARDWRLARRRTGLARRSSQVARRRPRARGSART